LSRWVKKMWEKMPALSHIFFTHAARAWDASPELGTHCEVDLDRPIW